MTNTFERVTAVLYASRFGAAVVRDHGRSWDGRELVAVEWSWKDDERAKLVAFLREAVSGATVTDRVSCVLVAVK